MCDFFLGCCAITPLFVVTGLELIMLPISIPFSVYRKRKYDKWIAEWYSLQTVEVKKLCDDYFEGQITYKSMNRKITFLARMLVSCCFDDAEAEKNFHIIPKYILRRNRYAWNLAPEKSEFFKRMDYLASALQILHLDPQPRWFNERRLKSLIVASRKPCILCTKDMATNNSVVTSCGHIFHKDCFRAHCSQTKKCPICHETQIGMSFLNFPR